MASPLVVVVLVAASDASSPASQAMIDETREALGAGTLVLVEKTKAPPSDVDAKRIGEAVHADAVVVVRWGGPGQESAHLHVRIVREKRWSDRDLVFRPADAPRERGRAVGLAIATVVPGEEPPSSAPAVGVPAAPPVLRPVAPETPAPPRAAPHPRFTFDAAAIGALGIGGEAFGVGAELAGRIAWSGGAFRVGGGARFGDVDAAHASSATVRFGGGPSVDAARWSGGALRVQVDALLLRQVVTRRTVGGELEIRGRTVAGADLALDAEWSLGPKLSTFGALGLELAFGETRVVVGSETVEVIPRLRPFALLGFRFGL